MRYNLIGITVQLMPLPPIICSALKSTMIYLFRLASYSGRSALEKAVKQTF